MSAARQNETIDTVVSIWAYVRSLTYDLLEVIPSPKLTQKVPRPGLDQIGKHFLEMADVTEAYATGLRTGSVSFESVRWTFPAGDLKSKNVLRESLKRSDRKLRSAVKGARARPTREYDLGGESIGLVEMIMWLALHELLHHGQLVAYGYLLDTGFPATWVEQWALPIEDES